MDKATKELNVDDVNFFKLIIAELVSMEASLKPILHGVIKTREKTLKLRTSLSAICVPEMIQFKKTLEEKRLIRVKEYDDLQALKNPLEEVMYTKLLIPTACD